ncbi:MAG TPA: sigma-70 family RNA polymerase sigma factor [Pyrinomonadaceae bacterium]|jgi:RNA polymerase sigma-70 factor (ECF subfamily)
MDDVSTSGDNLKEEAVPATAQHLQPVPHPPPPAEGLESLFREHYDQIFRTAYRVTGSASDAEDVLQTVFLRLARREEGLDLQPHPGAYLHRAAINASLDLVRMRTNSRPVALEDAEAELRMNPKLGPAAQHEDRELRRLIQQAVARLGTTASEMFVLRYFEGYGNREIAEMLNTSQMVVGVVLHRARTRLRKEIGEFLEEYHEA